MSEVSFRELLEKAIDALYESTAYTKEGDPISERDRKNDSVISALRAGQSAPGAVAPSVLEGPSEYKRPKFTPEELADGAVAIRWVTAQGVAGRPTLHDVLDYIHRRGDAIACTCSRCTTFTASAAQSAIKQEGA